MKRTLFIWFAFFIRINQENDILFTSLLIDCNICIQNGFWHK
jgi:hypothetical protein